MQFLFKFALSAAVALAAIGSWLYMNQLGLGGPRLAVTFLGPFTIVSLWLFSDVMRNRADGRTPATMAKEFSHE
jgi:hypothetical protein